VTRLSVIGCGYLGAVHAGWRYRALGRPRQVELAFSP
jgi:hypothetical protein